MTNRDTRFNTWIKTRREQALRLSRSHRLRTTALIVAILLALFGLLGFFVAPGIVKDQLEKQLAAQLDRPVTVGAVHVNPYNLRLEVDKLHIGERNSTASFIDVDTLTVSASWGSFIRMAPVLDEILLKHPQIHISRIAPHTFNFSDIVQRFASKAVAAHASPTRFALSNISVHSGEITFDDKVQNAVHHLDHIELGIPFLANLPSDTNIYVQPLLALRIDGSPLQVQGQTKPFSNTHESVISFTLDHLNLAKYLDYVPVALPAAIPSGQLSGKLDVHFIQATPTPQLLLQGALQADDLVLTTHTNTPILELKHGNATLTDVQPLLSRYRFNDLQLDGAALHYDVLPGNHTNLDALLGRDKPADPHAPPTDLQINLLTLENSALDYADRTGAKPLHLVLNNLHGTVQSLSMVSPQPGTINLTSSLADGTMHATGHLSMSASRFNGDVDMSNVALQPLIAMTPPMLNAEITQGSLNGTMHLQADWSKTLAITLDDSKLVANDFVLARRGGKPVTWKSLAAGIHHLDLGAHAAQLDNLTVQGLDIQAYRLRNGHIDLAYLLKSAPPPPRPKGEQRSSTPTAWHWNIAHTEVNGSSFTLRDPNLSGKGRLIVRADHFVADALSDDMRKPVKLDLKGRTGRGTFHIYGSVRPEPADASLRVVANRLDVAPFASFVEVPLNVRIDSADLSANGHIRYRDHKPAPFFSYQGWARLGRVHILDKVTNDDFLRWNSLSATGLRVRMGKGTPLFHVGSLALNDFYARIIMNANGRLNLQDVVSNPAEAPVSVTRAQNGTAPATNPPSSTSARTPAANSSTGAALAQAATTTAPADIHIGQIILASGNLNYTDNFIKPNYTANITQLAGKIGAFGTDNHSPPADVTLQGELDNNSPVDINGTINPLTPVAFLDIKAKADDVELTHLTPYSGKYAGYPITKGRLTMDVHYRLDQGNLNADNHIMLNQLTFGDRMEGPGIRHLPVKLAVALLKDSNGNIDIHVPVSGSLSDPEFSLGGVIWQAFVNLIKRAVTSPFRLLASAGGSQQDLGYVEFAPGSAVLDAQAQARLAQIVDILKQKNSLKLDITGRVDPSFDVAGLRKVTVDDEVQKEEADDIGTAAAKAAPVKPGTDDYKKYLTKAYKHAKFKKPRDFLGLTKSQPPEEMIKLMEAHVTVDQDALRHLAERRADVVRQYLRAKIADNRVFVLAPKLSAQGIEDKGKTTRDDFGLHQ